MQRKERCGFSVVLQRVCVLLIHCAQLGWKYWRCRLMSEEGERFDVDAVVPTLSRSGVERCMTMHGRA